MSGLLFACVAATLAFALPPEPIPGGFTLAVLPDTQIYAWKYPETYFAQTRWIAENARRYDIAYALHLGDVTEHNSPEEWEIARKAHATLAGQVPCAVVPGNHDMGTGGKLDSRHSRLSDTFTVAEFRTWPSHGGVYDREPGKLDNSFHLFAAGGRRWLILALEYAPRDDVLRWAGEVVTRHADRTVIIVTHAYLQPNNRRYDRTFTKEKHIDRGAIHLDGGVNDGEDIWQKVIRDHANVALVVCGHIGITGRLDSTGTAGNVVHQMVVDYQSQPAGGGGFLRLLQFLPDGRTVRVRDYSPVSDETVADPDRAYDFKISAPPPAAR